MATDTLELSVDEQAFLAWCFVQRERRTFDEDAQDGTAMLQEWMALTGIELDMRRTFTRFVAIHDAQ